jgi:hypothetical protein
MPAMEIIAHEDTNLNLTSTFSIDNFDNLQQLFDEMIRDASVTWLLEASLAATVFGVRFQNIKFSKTLLLSGFGDFANRTVDSFAIRGYVLAVSCCVNRIFSVIHRTTPVW